METTLMNHAATLYRGKFGTVRVGDENSRSTINVVVANPSPLEEKNLGQLFFLIDIEDNRHEVNHRIMTFLEQELRHAYYYSQDFSIEHAFENALQEINQKMYALSHELDIDFTRSTHLLVGVVHNHTLYFSSVGDVRAFLVLNGRVMNILERTTQPQGSPVQPNRLFGHVLSGEISAQSLVLFATANFLDYFSLEKLRKTVENETVEKGAGQLTNLLSENENHDSFGALLLQLTPINIQSPSLVDETTIIEKLNQEIKSKAGLDSMNELVHQEKATSELLTPSLWPIIKRSLVERLAAIWDSMNAYKNRSPRLQPKTLGYSASPRAQHQPHHGSKRAWMIIASHYGKIILAWLFKILLQFLALGISGIRLLIRLFRSKHHSGVHSQFRSFPNQTTGFLGRLVKFFINLSRPRKILLIVSIFFVFLFAQSIITRGQNNEVVKAKKGADDQLKKVQSATIEAEAALNYKNEEGALTFLTEANHLLSQIPEDKKNKTERDSLSDKIKEIQNKIQKIIFIDQPTIFSDLRSIHPEINVQTLALANDQLIGFDGSNQSAYGISQTPIILSSHSDGPIAMESDNFDNGDIILLDSKGEFFSFSKNELKKIDVGFENQDRGIISFAAFSPSRLYTLDAKNNQIFKHQAVENGFSKGTPWMNDSSVNLQDAKSVAVDGSLYVLKENGKIIKLFGGKKENFQMSKIEPELGNATKIATSPNSKYLALLDPNNKRIVLFQKNGHIAGQFMSDAFDHLKDIVVNDSKGKIFALNGKTVFEIDLSFIQPEEKK